MTIFFRSHFFSFLFEKKFQGEIFQNRSYVSKTTAKIFASKGAVANSGSDISLLLLFSDGCGSAANKFYK